MKSSGLQGEPTLANVFIAMVTYNLVTCVFTNPTASNTCGCSLHDAHQVVPATNGVLVREAK